MRAWSLFTLFAFAACGSRTTSSVAGDAAVTDALAASDVVAPADRPAPVDLVTPVDSGFVADGAVARDAGSDAPDAFVPGRCRGVGDCTSAPLFPMTFGTGWSCIAGSCTWEQRAGRTCVREADGCFACDDGSAPACPGAPCVTSLARADVSFERLYCARDFFSFVRSCAGGFVSLDDGEVCTLTDAPTGAIRWVLACGPCETVFTPR